MENIKITACGVTANNRISITLKYENNLPYSLWHHTTFYKPEAALEYLKDLYQDGISQEDIDDGIWLTLQQLQEQKQ